MSTVAWVSGSMYFLLLVALCSVWKSEVKKIKMNSTKTIGSSSFYQRLMDIWAKTFMMVSIIATLLCLASNIRYICFVAAPTATIAWMLLKYLLTLYQISRLQMCFSSQQVHSKKYGYSKCCFVVLYIVPILLLSQLALLHTFGNSEVHYDEIYEVCIVTADKNGASISFLFTLLYLIWDWTVLWLYIYKIVQFHRKTTTKETNNNNNNNNNDVIFKRIHFILKKITILTILYEAIGIPLIVTVFTLIANNTLGLVLIDITWCLDIMMSSFLMYLMLEHNDQTYLRFIKFVCFCCPCLIQDGNDGNDSNAETKTTATNKTESDIYETRDHSIQMDKIVYVDESVATVTQT
eukprot:306495_1